MTARHRSPGPAPTRHLLDLPHHDGSPLHVGTRHPAPGEAVRVRVRVPHAHRARQVVVRVLRDGEPALSAAVVEHEDERETWWGADVLVHNPVTRYRFFLEGGPGSPVPYGWLNGTGLHPRDVPDHDDFVLSSHEPAPEWVEDAVVYQVFPDRFARSSGAPDVHAQGTAPGWAVPASWDEPVLPRDQDGREVAAQWFGGDLDGVAEHLDHLVDLGVTCLYLTPVFEGRSNHRYDASSFDGVDPALGGTDALVRLTAAAHARGLRVVGDLTTNHTGVEHEWFVEAAGDRDAPSAAYYRFRAHPHDYVSWLDVPSLPKLDHSSPTLRDALYRGRESVVGRWLHDPVALDGWRIDVANMTGRYAHADDAHDVARDLRATMAAARDETGRETWLLAEHGHDAGGDLAGDGWHGTMNYTGFTRPVWTWLRPDPAPPASSERERVTFLGLPVEVPRLPGGSVARTMDAFRAGMPWRAWTASSTQLDSHDTARVRTVLGGGEGYPADGGPSGAAHRGEPAAELARELHHVAVALLLTLPGVPTVFAGDEIGLTGVNGEHSRTPFPWHDRDAWDERTLAWHRLLVGLRREHVALRRGGFRWVAVQDDSLTFLREHPDQRVLVHVARAEHPPVEIPVSALGTTAVREGRALVGGDGVRQSEQALTLSCAGPAACVYLLGVD
jgi:alpha-glucosidase